MRIEKCYFCSSPCYPGHGSMFVRNDGKTFRFCRKKCHKSFKMKRNPRKTKWTKAYRKLSGKELGIDPIFELEKRKDIPIRYNAILVDNTIECMDRVSEIHKKRETQFYINRMMEVKETTNKTCAEFIEKEISLVETPRAEISRNMKKLMREKNGKKIPKREKASIRI